MTLQEESLGNKYSDLFLLLASASDLLLDFPNGRPKQKPEAQNTVDVIHISSIEKDGEGRRVFKGPNRISPAQFNFSS